MTVAIPKIRMTVPEFFAWWDEQAPDERFELIDGEIVAMGRDRISHNRAKMRAAQSLAKGIAAAGLDCEAFVDGIGVSPNTGNFRLPNAVVNCGPVDPNAVVLPNSVVVVEVVSPRSEGRDVHEKLADYFSIESVRHYLIVYPDRGFVVHHARAELSEPLQTRFVRSGLIELAPPGFAVDVNDLLGTLPANATART